MPGQHAEGTKLIGLYAERELIDKIDKVRDYNSRSDFLRDAVVEYMQRRGCDVPDRLRRAPDRSGKGGPAKYQISSKADARATAAAKRAAAAARGASPKPKR